MEEENLLNSIKSISEGSNKVSTWALSVVGGTVLVIISDSYFQPQEQIYKIPYLLFIAGWLYIAISMYYGLNISGRVMAAELYKKDNEKLKAIFTKANNDFDCQLIFFKAALVTFGVWLILYLLWWILIFTPQTKP